MDGSALGPLTLAWVGGPHADEPQRRLGLSHFLFSYKYVGRIAILNFTSQTATSVPSSESSRNLLCPDLKNYIVRWSNDMKPGEIYQDHTKIYNKTFGHGYNKYRIYLPRSL